MEIGELEKQRAILKESLKRVEEEIATQSKLVVKEKPDFNLIVEYMNGWVDEMETAVKLGEPYEQSDSEHYLFECVVQALYTQGDFYDLYNKASY